jgi:hypothetical protein
MVPLDRAVNFRSSPRSRMILRSSVLRMTSGSRPLPMDPPRVSGSCSGGGRRSWCRLPHFCGRHRLESFASQSAISCIAVPCPAHVRASGRAGRPTLAIHRAARNRPKRSGGRAPAPKSRRRKPALSRRGRPSHRAPWAVHALGTVCVHHSLDGGRGHHGYSG